MLQSSRTIRQTAARLFVSKKVDKDILKASASGRVVCLFSILS